MIRADDGGTGELSCTLAQELATLLNTRGSLVIVCAAAFASTGRGYTYKLITMQRAGSHLHPL